MDHFNVYSDIQARTGGEIYIGVVGPVRTGKSTFIKRFMELLVLPGLEDVHARERARDELPQSSAGKTIMTTEPKFIPKEAAKLSLGDGVEVRVRLIDCVGFMVEGAAGHIENEKERMVRTPWYEEEIPFTAAAELGTRSFDDRACGYGGRQFRGVETGELCSGGREDRAGTEKTGKAVSGAFKLAETIFGGDAGAGSPDDRKI